MEETREVTRDVYRAISAAQHQVHNLISDAMDGLAAGPLTGEWHQLHCMMQAASIIGTLASEGREHAPDPDAPIPCLPASVAFTAFDGS
jgi:hypothetical protein